jgi:hypothetical protein
MSEAIRSATIIAAARLVMLISGLFVALVPMSAQSAESQQEKSIMIIAVEHIRIESAKLSPASQLSFRRRGPRACCHRPH